MKTLKRDSDGKIFQVIYPSHWSDIQAEDKERDVVKWYGPGYVSSKTGETYRHIEDCDCCEKEAIIPIY